MQPKGPTVRNLIAFTLALSGSELTIIQPGHAQKNQSGIASIYSVNSGSGTASGEKLNPGALTAAHRTLPFGTKVLVTNKRNGRSAVVRINDRGPFVKGRVIDLTPASARALGFAGLTQVEVQVLN